MCWNKSSLGTMKYEQCIKGFTKIYILEIVLHNKGLKAFIRQNYQLVVPLMINFFFVCRRRRMEKNLCHDRSSHKKHLILPKHYSKHLKSFNQPQNIKIIKCLLIPLILKGNFVYLLFTRVFLCTSLKFDRPHLCFYENF